MHKFDVLHGFIATDLGENESDEDLHITISGHQENGGPMYQNITVFYFDTKEKADTSTGVDNGREMLWSGAKVPPDLSQKHRLICRKSSGYAWWFGKRSVSLRPE